MLYLFCVLAGFVLGLLYFGGLWWTTQQAMSAKKPAVLFLISFFVRTLIVVVAFYFIMDGQWERLLLALGGFILARYLIKRRLLKKR